MCGQVGDDDDDVKVGEAGRRCALEGDEHFEEEAGKVKVIASMRMRIKIMWMRLRMRIKRMEMRIKRIGMWRRMKCKEEVCIGGRKILCGNKRESESDWQK